MNFFDLYTEIRLLVYLESIAFVADYGPPWPPLLRSKRHSLCLALHYVNKNVYSEASLLLYSNNRSQFPDIFTSTLSATNGAYIALFLCQIGS